MAEPELNLKEGDPAPPFTAQTNDSAETTVRAPIVKDAKGKK